MKTMNRANNKATENAGLRYVKVKSGIQIFRTSITKMTMVSMDLLPFE